MCRTAAPILRPSPETSWGAPARTAASARKPAVTALATKSIATNSSPLPRNTVAKNRSSRWPIRSRTTPMNQRNAIPAKGTRFSARTTRRRFAGSETNGATSAGSAGAASRTRTNAVVSRTANSTPAIPAARGVRSERDSAASSSIRPIFEWRNQSLLAWSGTIAHLRILLRHLLAQDPPHLLDRVGDGLGRMARVDDLLGADAVQVRARVVHDAIRLRRERALAQHCHDGVDRYAWSDGARRQRLHEGIVRAHVVDRRRRELERVAGLGGDVGLVGLRKIGDTFRHVGR